MTAVPVALEDLARLGIDGDRDAVEHLVKAVQGDVYGLALRMLWNREDAEDATQEIIVRVVTGLSQFNFRSRLQTWVYRIAVNYILDVKKSRVERMHLTFDRYAEELADGLSSAWPTDVERSLLVEEVKIGCTLGMLQCLDRPHRLAYVLGEILDLSGPESAEALGISAELFRKRLQHARTAIEAFTRAHCGLASDRAACACHRRVPAAVRLGRVHSRCARLCRATVVISGDPRARQAGRAGTVGVSGPSHQSAAGLDPRLRASAGPVTQLTL